MSILNQIKTVLPEAPRITLYGVGGIGKSTLANCFPRPLFLLTETSALINSNVIGPITSFSEIWDCMNQLLAVDDLPYKTIVIDSISKLDQLIIEYILNQEPVKKDVKKLASLATACGGYGAGYQAAAQLHRSFKAKMDKFQNKGISVVYIGHVTTLKHRAPDCEDYDKYSIVMNSDKSREPYLDDVDAVLFCKQKSYTSTTDSGRNLIVSGEDRIILSGISESHVSKNRFDMPSEIAMSFDELKKYIPFYKSEE